MLFRSPFAYVDDHAFIENSIIFDNVKVGNNAKIEKSIISSGVIIPPGVEIGFDEALDRKRGFIPNIKDSPTNIRVITADMNLEAIINDIK